MTMQSTAQGKGLFNREQMLKLGFRFDDTASPVPPPKPAEVTFTREQQEKLNAIAADERRAGEAKATKALLERFGVSSVEDLEAKIKPPSDKKPDPDPIAVRDAEWKAKLDAAESKRQEIERAYKDRDKRASLVDAAVKAKAIDPALVADIAAKSFDFDDKGNLIVVGESGPRLGASGYMTPQEFIVNFLAEKPYLMQPSGTSGGGSGPNNGPNGASVTDIDAKISAANKAGDVEASVRLTNEKWLLSQKGG